MGHSDARAPDSANFASVTSTSASLDSGVEVSVGGGMGGNGSDDGVTGARAGSNAGF